MPNENLLKKASELIPLLPGRDGVHVPPAEMPSAEMPPAELPSVFLRQDESGLSLVGDSGLVMQGDFTKLLPRLKPNNLNGELLVKAAKIKDSACPTAVDATAGMGEDSLLLAAAGFRVKLFEQDPVIAALLADTMERAVKEPGLCDIVSRMELVCGNSIEELPKLDFVPDVIVLDPMFPERTKSASVKKKFQLIHQLERPCEEEAELLAAALATGAHKIVIKRPLKGALLAGHKPSYSLTGKAIRYDVIVQV